MMWGIIITIGVLVNGHLQVTRHVPTHRYGNVETCVDNAEQLKARLRKAAKSATTVVKAACGRQPDIPA